MRYQIIDGVRTQLTSVAVTEAFDQIVANFRVLTGEETLEFDTAEQVRSALSSLSDLVPILQQHQQGRWVIITPGQLPVSSAGEVVDLMAPLTTVQPQKKAKPAAKTVSDDEAPSIDEIDLFAEALSETVLAPVVKTSRIKPVVDQIDLEVGDSVLELTGPQARVLNDVLFALQEESYVDFDAEDRQIALDLTEMIVAEDGTLETVLIVALELALINEEPDLTERQIEVLTEAARVLSQHVEG